MTALFSLSSYSMFKFLINENDFRLIITHVSLRPFSLFVRLLANISNRPTGITNKLSASARHMRWKRAAMWNQWQMNYVYEITTYMVNRVMIASLCNLKSVWEWERQMCKRETKKNYLISLTFIRVDLFLLHFLLLGTLVSCCWLLHLQSDHEFHSTILLIVLVRFHDRKKMFWWHAFIYLFIPFIFFTLSLSLFRMI